MVMGIATLPVTTTALMNPILNNRVFSVVWYCEMIRCVFFFFQAEDGIRDWSVTGVQTCALPILLSLALAIALTASAGKRPNGEALGRSSHWARLAASLDHTCAIPDNGRLFCWGDKIGRASCRERV